MRIFKKNVAYLIRYRIINMMKNRSVFQRMRSVGGRMHGIFTVLTLSFAVPGCATGPRIKLESGKKAYFELDFMGPGKYKRQLNEAYKLLLGYYPVHYWPQERARNFKVYLAYIADYDKGKSISDLGLYVLNDVFSHPDVKVIYWDWIHRPGAMDIDRWRAIQYGGCPSLEEPVNESGQRRVLAACAVTGRGFEPAIRITNFFFTLDTISQAGVLLHEATHIYLSGMSIGSDESEAVAYIVEADFYRRMGKSEKAAEARGQCEEFMRNDTSRFRSD